jgi:hypothetical protein
MTYLFKLARRAARFRALLLPALALVFGGCDTDRLASPSGDAATTAMSGPVAAPLTMSLSSTFRGGMPFGTTGHPYSDLGGVYNGVLRIIGPDDLMPDLATIKARGSKVVLNLAGGQSRYKDGSGHFSFSLWKASVDRFKGINFASYIEDGTIIGHYLVDEPNDATNWNGDPISGSMVDAMAGYSKQLWPKMPTIVRAYPSYLAEWSGDYRYLDAAWAQYVERKGDVGAFITENVSLAKSKGLALAIGLNILKGGPNQAKLTASQIESWGSKLLANTYPCAFISWEYDEAYLERSDIKTAMSHLSQLAGALPGRSCSSAPISLPGITGIVLTATRQVHNGVQSIVLKWSGASGTRVDLYRNGVLTRKPINDGLAVSTPRRAGRYVFKLCETRSSRCSKSAAATIF